jgi:hypothetical protein
MLIKIFGIFNNKEINDHLVLSWNFSFNQRLAEIIIRTDTQRRRVKILGIFRCSRNSQIFMVSDGSLLANGPSREPQEK